ncbi:hypothetical protein Pmar_PMAR004858 [Perkinsus marinus ATCC 50983]|uniref:Uncharacterized protein n=1 Tax=Perkinsus marinus (strain ATCC 50983 / TXsc) TaxID=423536 RepID=C5LL78_PERM5|nr:hypothetical protein Pmar_PMAR004858 [Perkinsus marinus ATCC 50983]EER02495.1 hypothetical protein Pmar_PMAR004858 [Perkinsus marinus ATCC 50983]|eukprot:XP_002769777.1 hypothetical protein Pmar_PMAR004858 [Perkinsus marinus ATCC 50983]
MVRGLFTIARPLLVARRMATREMEECENRFRISRRADVSELGRMAHLYLRKNGDNLVFEAVGTEATSIALKAAAAAMKLADEKKPIEMEITGPTEEIAKTMGGIGPLCMRKIVEALEIAGAQCDDGRGRCIRTTARFENVPCGKGITYFS